ncbi:carbon-nitrogen family hydrolase [Ornithinibacillus sp. 4-3]|uniref:Carbon-nitrogen family hydrolase n=1 Tax=Ornithinibacillus sp. 4-3 TaxID=3231488 RepID=A0AB39HLX9_9BACI
MGASLKWVDKVVQDEKPDVLVLPEMWTTAFALPELKDIADVNGEPTTTFLKDLAKTYQVNIIGGSIANKKDDSIYNTSLVVDRQGNIVYQYDKIHLVPMLDEHKYLAGGKEKVKTFELEGVKMGVIICYDLRFPELARKLALDGAKVLHIVAEWPNTRKEHWKNLQIARAIENQMYVVSSNIVGTYNNEEFAGTSMIIDPWGSPLKTGSEDTEETLIADIKIDSVSKIRNDVPIFSSRVPELY